MWPKIKTIQTMVVCVYYHFTWLHKCTYLFQLTFIFLFARFFSPISQYQRDNIIINTTLTLRVTNFKRFNCKKRYRTPYMVDSTWNEFIISLNLWMKNPKKKWRIKPEWKTTFNHQFYEHDSSSLKHQIIIFVLMKWTLLF